MTGVSRERRRAAPRRSSRARFLREGSPVSAKDPFAGLVEPLAVISRFRAHDGSLHDFLAARVEHQPDAVAVEFEGCRWTYAELATRCEAWAALLVRLGVIPGARIAVMALNHPNTVALLFAAARLDAILVPLNPAYSAAEARYVIEHAGVSGVFVTSDTAHIVETALQHVNETPWVLGLDDASPEAGGNVPPAIGRADQPCLIIYTSGTTGRPKGAVHSQRGYVLTAEFFVERLWLQPDERVMCVMPMFHINALMYSVGGALACGGTLVLVRRFSASTFWATAAETRSTEVNLVASAGAILAQRPREEFVASHRIAKMFVAPQTRQMVDALRNECNVPLLIECYGMTEIPGVISNPFKGPHKLGTMGVLCKHPDPRIERPRARIVDEQGSDVKPGEVGELLVRTPTLMLGYFRDPAQTAAAFLDGWFRTGDLVTRQSDGYFRFVARKKDIIRRRGENIASAEIERVIAAHPDVHEVAVIGVPSELGEEEILAAIVPASGKAPSPVEMTEWVRSQLAAAKVPRYLSFVSEIPHTPTHKPAKHRLREDPRLLACAIDMQQDSGPRTGDRG
jgi:crotonobetaine/carnitine-CoA ligase